MLADLRQTPEPTCADNCCAHHTVPISRGAAFYQSFGVTRFGSRRYRCTAYHKTFSVRKSTAGQKQLLRNTHNFGGVNIRHNPRRHWVCGHPLGLPLRIPPLIPPFRLC